MFYRYLSLFIAVSFLTPTVDSNLSLQQSDIHWTSEISAQALTARAGFSGRSSPALITVTDLFEHLPHSAKTYGMLGEWRWLHTVASFFGYDTWVPLKIAPRFEELRYTVWPLVRHHFLTGWIRTAARRNELRESSAEKFADAHPYVLHVAIQKGNRKITWKEANAHDRANLKRLNNATFDVFSEAMDSAFGTLTPWNSPRIIKAGWGLITKIHSAHNWLVHEFGGSYAMTAYVHVADEEETEELLLNTSYEVVGIRNPADADDTRFGLIPKDFKPTSKFVRVFSPSGSEVVSTDQIIYISREIGDLIEKESTDHLVQMGMDSGTIEAIRLQQPVTLQQVKSLWGWYQEPAERFEKAAEQPALTAPIIDAPAQPLEPETITPEPQTQEQPEPVTTPAREVSQTDLNTFITLAVRVLLRDAIHLGLMTEKSVFAQLVEAGHDQTRASIALKRSLSNKNILIEMVYAIYDVLKNSTIYTDSLTNRQDPIATDLNSLFTFIGECILNPFTITSEQLAQGKQIRDKVARHLYELKIQSPAQALNDAPVDTPSATQNTHTETTPGAFDQWLSNIQLGYSSRPESVAAFTQKKSQKPTLFHQQTLLHAEGTIQITNQFANDILRVLIQETRSWHGLSIEVFHQKAEINSEILTAPQFKRFLQKQNMSQERLMELRNTYLRMAPQTLNRSIVPTSLQSKWDELESKITHHTHLLEIVLALYFNNQFISSQLLEEAQAALSNYSHLLKEKHDLEQLILSNELKNHSAHNTTRKRFLSLAGFSEEIFYELINLEPISIVHLQKAWDALVSILEIRLKDHLPTLPNQTAVENAQTWNITVDQVKEIEQLLTKTRFGWYRLLRMARPEKEGGISSAQSDYRFFIVSKILERSFGGANRIALYDQKALPPKSDLHQLPGHLLIKGVTTRKGLVTIRGLRFGEFSHYRECPFLLELQNDIPQRVVFYRKNECVLITYLHLTDPQTGRIKRFYTTTMVPKPAEWIDEESLEIDVILSSQGQCRFGGGKPIFQGTAPNATSPRTPIWFVAPDHPHERIRVRAYKGLIVSARSLESDWSIQLARIVNRHTREVEGVYTNSLSGYDQINQLQDWHMVVGHPIAGPFLTLNDVDWFKIPGSEPRRLTITEIRHNQGNPVFAEAWDRESNEFFPAKGLCAAYHVPAENSDNDSFTKGPLIGVYESYFAKTAKQVGALRTYIASQRLDDQGRLSFLLDSWYLSAFPNAFVEVKVINGEARYVHLVADQDGLPILTDTFEPYIVDLQARKATLRTPLPPAANMKKWLSNLMWGGEVFERIKIALTPHMNSFEGPRLFRLFVFNLFNDSPYWSTQIRPLQHSA